MEISDLKKYMELLDKAGLVYFLTKNEEYLVFENLNGNSIMIAEFNTNGDLVDITADHNFNSLDEVRDLWQST
jgi:uncharacterized pyridoxamine 5'-phosphate oxidase family protein